MSSVSTLKWNCDRCGVVVHAQERPKNWMPIWAQDRASDIAIGNPGNSSTMGHFCFDCASEFSQWLSDKRGKRR